jgi:predicted dehydrogenase
MTVELATVGIIGLGNIGFSYDSGMPDSFARTHARAATFNPQTKLLWGVDPAEKARTGFEAEYAVSAFAKLEIALESKPIDVAVLATQLAYRAKIWPLLLAAKPKLIISEKPLAPTAQECIDIAESCAEAGVGLLVNYPRRYSEVTKRAKQLIDFDELGKLQSGHVWYGKGVTNNGSHLINLLMHLVGGDWNVGDVSPRRHGYPDGDIDAVFRMTRDDCSIAFSVTDPELFSLAEIDLIFERGRLRFMNHATDLVWQVGLVPTRFHGYSELAEEQTLIDKTGDKYQLNVMSYAVDRLCDSTAFARDVKDAISTALIVDSVIELGRQK